MESEPLLRVDRDTIKFAMGRRKIKRKGHVQPPSIFFMVALALGVILFMILFILAVRNPARPVPPKRKRAAVSAPLFEAGRFANRRDEAPAS